MAFHFKFKFSIFLVLFDFNCTLFALQIFNTSGDCEKCRDELANDGRGVLFYQIKLGILVSQCYNSIEPKISLVENLYFKKSDTNKKKFLKINLKIQLIFRILKIDYKYFKQFNISIFLRKMLKIDNLQMACGGGYFKK